MLKNKTIQIEFSAEEKKTLNRASEILESLYEDDEDTSANIIAENIFIKTSLCDLYEAYEKDGGANLFSEIAEFLRFLALLDKEALK